MTFLCPYCRVPLNSAVDALDCSQCGRRFSTDGATPDFSEGHYYDSFSGPGELTPNAISGLEQEFAGTISRIREFYEPLLVRHGAKTVLDCGAGNGIGVDTLVDDGYDAWGLDLSALRKWQWQERKHRERLVVADAMRTPFPDGYFDVVLSSGVIEHIGVTEYRDPTYRVRPLPERDDLRRAFLRELMRVCRPEGHVYIDCPNGSFPIDFWHGTTVAEPRFHSWTEGFLPAFGEIRRLVRSIRSTAGVEAVSPFGRLRFRQSRARWFGRLLATPAEAFFQAMNHRPLRWLASSPFNPYLVVRIDVT